MSAVVLAMVLLSPIPLMWLFSGSLRLAKVHRDVLAAWWSLESALRNRHEALDSVRRVCRRHGLDATLGLAALSEAQAAAREAINGPHFDAIVSAERELDQRVMALKGLLAYQVVSPDVAEILDLVACLDLLDGAISRATSEYNRAVESNNLAAQQPATAWLAAATGRRRAFAFRSTATTDDYQFMA